ncbi:general secretion pathway protein GspB [Hydrogenophaga sp.]|uniref:general secretion pathway protein GspB n=1 Tax=Hydrogenophaga sp. TaxID=1904254 RepID=UPI0025C0C997|nr:general secretion pathway protein GspB [Hydrogenophaga sp.]
MPAPPAEAVAPPATPPVTPATGPILAPAPVQPPPAKAAAAETPPPASDKPLPSINDLAPSQRAGLPPLKVSGVTYAETPSLRMLILDGQVVQEGQDIAAGVTLESIGQRSAVINHQGQRLRLSY